jgi:anti-sigma B factor antagonist
MAVTARAKGRGIGVEALEIISRSEGAYEIVSPRGEIDVATQTTLRAKLEDLIASGRTDIVVDLAETTFLDSTGLGALIGARRRTYALDGSFAIICANPRMRELFAITRLDLVFRVHETFDEWAAARPT